MEREREREGVWKQELMVEHCLARLSSGQNLSWPRSRGLDEAPPSPIFGSETFFFWQSKKVLEHNIYSQVQFIRHPALTRYTKASHLKPKEYNFERQARNISQNGNFG